MLHETIWRRAAACIVAIGVAALLSACLLAPGRFVSTLDIRKDGQFTFTYKGEIHLLALSKLAEEAAPDAFTANPCYDDDSGETRDCTKDEIAKQKAEWNEGKAAREEKRKQDNEQMRAMLGGIDPSNPKAADELAARLRRQAGWKRVDYKGDGLFDVDFTLTSKAAHDFAFPTMERFPMANPFVLMAVRNDGSLRIDAPAFAGTAADPLKMMMLGKAGDESADGTKLPKLDGQFTITTDAKIMANNTDEGPQADASLGQRLHWIIGPSGQAAPMALLQLGK